MFCFKACTSLFLFSFFFVVLFIAIVKYKHAVVAQVAEHVIGNDEVPSSSLGNGTLIILTVFIFSIIYVC